MRNRLRQILFPNPTYRWFESARLFRAIDYLIEKLLKQGIPVVLDATNLSARYCRKLYSLAGDAGIKFIPVWITAPPSVVYERLKARARSTTGYSDADWEVYRWMRPGVEKFIISITGWNPNRIFCQL